MAKFDQLVFFYQQPLNGPVKNFLIKREMPKEHFASLITTLIPSQEGARELCDKIQKKFIFFQNSCRAVPGTTFPKICAVACRAGGTQFVVCRAVPVPADFSESFPSLL